MGFWVVVLALVLCINLKNKVNIIQGQHTGTCTLIESDFAGIGHSRRLDLETMATLYGIFPAKIRGEKANKS